MQDELLHQLQGFGVHLRRLPPGLQQVADVNIQVIQQLLGCAQDIPRQQRLADVAHHSLESKDKNRERRQIVRKPAITKVIFGDYFEGFNAEVLLHAEYGATITTKTPSQEMNSMKV